MCIEELETTRSKEVYQFDFDGKREDTRIKEVGMSQVAKCFYISVMLSIFSFGCNLQSTSSDCVTGQTARITILDGAINRSCGCTEGSGTFAPTNSFQCTLKVGTHLYINYNTSSYHYLNFGTSSGVTPQWYTPGTDSQVGAVTFSSTSPLAGFNFSDSGNSVSGVFIITN